MHCVCKGRYILARYGGHSHAVSWPAWSRRAPRYSVVSSRAGIPRNPTVRTHCAAWEGSWDRMWLFKWFWAKSISKIVISGTCSDSYSKENYGTFTLFTELPHFYDARIADSTPMAIVRSDAATQNTDFGVQPEGDLSKIWTLYGREKFLSLCGLWRACGFGSGAQPMHGAGGASISTACNPGGILRWCVCHTGLPVISLWRVYSPPRICIWTRFG